MIRMCVAVDAHGGFGFQGSIPWNIREDFDHFKSTVQNGVCIVGLNTFLDMVKMMSKNGKIYKTALVNTTRHVIVSSYTQETCPPEIKRILDQCKIKHHLVNSVKAAVRLCTELYLDTDVWFIGGRGIFNEGLDYCDEVIQTVIPACYECDTWFPTDKLMDKFSPSLLKKLYPTSTAPLPVLRWERKKSA